jgi:hypothetical protein
MMDPITVVSIVRIAVIVGGLHALRVRYKQAERAEIPDLEWPWH